MFPIRGGVRYLSSPVRTCLNRQTRLMANVGGAGKQFQAEVERRLEADRTTRRRARAGFWTFAAGAFICLGAYGLGSAFPPSVIRLISPRPAAAPPPPDSPEALAQVQRLEKQLMSLPQVLELSKKTDGPDAEYYEARPYATYPRERAVNSLTAGALRGAGRLAIPPLVFAKRDESEAKVFIHVGRGVCGHDGIVHGGLTATLLDEALARQAFLNLPSHLGVTATLTVNYRAPVMADQFILIETKLDTVKGRKATVSGCIYDLDGKLLAESSALYIEPKYAQVLANGDVKHLLGVHTKPSVGMEEKPHHRAGTGEPMPMAGEQVIHGEPPKRD
ncbi:Thioesterase/thiol ester dehydrase-isomerase [Dacryopinax primogenitus]|uniref:Thioesterase/thiol ester dehydrase-isomerase n=1 Tax=Dacryopinax primogenitus (strain DJM 731) TaxID=1858805 RepID=M5FYE7_DACPD|nr:Thioesterase/thiol ester dehydrase-isomerase [Dacryopinax primogenitus]EJT96547.1 Thioesterase/thiol ester dehydrase-isomerase [Dacryopinax primogenitus]